jgi:hypothetical protein
MALKTPTQICEVQTTSALTECLLAYPRPNEGQRVNGTRLPTRGGDEEVRMGPRGPIRLDAQPARLT